jgi:hypothetical protein
MKWAFATKKPFAEEWAKMTDTHKLPAYKGKRHVLKHVYKLK